MSVEYGGKTVYGASVGIIMLETRFPRILGDIANAMTWPFPVQYRIVPGATPDNVVRKDPRGKNIKDNAAQLWHIWADGDDGDDLDSNAAEQLARIGEFDMAIACWRRIKQSKKNDPEVDKMISDLSIHKTIQEGKYEEAESSTEVRKLCRMNL